MWITTSARLIFAAAPSKVPFYIAGGLLVVWALVLAAWGISHAEFPGSPGRARLAMLTSFMLVAATMAAAVVTGGEEAEEHASEAGGAPAATGRTLALAADPTGALRFDKTRAAVLAGRVTVRLTNDSTVEHNVTIARGSETLGATKTITDAKDTLTVELARGEYVFFCSVAGHRASGMEGELTVE
jgi:plastocyanin